MAFIVHGRRDQGVVAFKEIAEGEGLIGLLGVELRLASEVAFGEELYGGDLSVDMTCPNPERQRLGCRELVGGEYLIVEQVHGDDGDVNAGKVLFVPAEVIHRELVGQLRVLQPAVEGWILAVMRGVLAEWIGRLEDSASQEFLRHRGDGRVLIAEAECFLAV